MNHSDTQSDLSPYLEDIDETGHMKRLVPEVLHRDVPDLQTIYIWFSNVRREWLNQEKMDHVSTELRKRSAELGLAVGKIVKRRSLTSELLLFQLAVSLIIGIVALSVLWVASYKSIQDSMWNWSEQWLGTLDEIGMPLYLSSGTESYQAVEEYIEIFPEIAFVRFYDDTGELIFEDMRIKSGNPLPALSPQTLTDLLSQSEDDKQHFIDSVDDDLQLMRVGKPIWTEALLTDGLIGLDLNDEDAVEETLVGFVELGLDTTRYREDLKKMVGGGLSWGLLLLILLCVASWFVYRHALKPLSALQHPLKKLAEGQTDFVVESSGHMEITVITDALNTTLDALKEREQRLFFLANHDPLTGLVNRHKFMEKFEQELGRLYEADIYSSLLFIDLDHFKYLNDTAGHAAGDRLLQDIAQRLMSCVRERDTVARFGGDEFVILLSDIDEAGACEISERLIATIGESHIVEKDEKFTVRCSIGMTFIRNTEFSAADLLTQADMACHKAKNKGRNRFEMYESSSDTMVGLAQEFGLSHQISEALKNDGFVLQFQPIVSIATGETAHFETLLRMRTRDSQGRRKMMLPDAFIPAAVRFDLMVDVDRWVLRHAIEHLAVVRQDAPDTLFTINVSGNMFETPNFTSYLESVLKEFKVPMNAIVIEITEQVAVRQLSWSSSVISKLSARGCKFALDDFGAGFSSYTYLKELPVDFIKIDGSFIRDIVDDEVDQKIVSSLVEIARVTGRETVAEHVASVEALDVLRKLGVDYAQGHFLGRPNRKLKDGSF